MTPAWRCGCGCDAFGGPGALRGWSGHLAPFQGPIRGTQRALQTSAEAAWALVQHAVGNKKAQRQKAVALNGGSLANGLGLELPSPLAMKRLRGIVPTSSSEVGFSALCRAADGMRWGGWSLPASWADQPCHFRQPDLSLSKRTVCEPLLTPS